jgi:hypothetical protein
MERVLSPEGRDHRQETGCNRKASTVVYVHPTQPVCHPGTVVRGEGFRHAKPTDEDRMPGGAYGRHLVPRKDRLVPGADPEEVAVRGGNVCSPWPRTHVLTNVPACQRCSYTSLERTFALPGGPGGPLSRCGEPRRIALRTEACARHPGSRPGAGRVGLAASLGPCGLPASAVVCGRAVLAARPEVREDMPSRADGDARRHARAPAAPPLARLMQGFRDV